VHEDGEERLSVRLLVKGAASVRADQRRTEVVFIQSLDLRRQVEQALGAHEEAVFRPSPAPVEPDKLVQHRVRGAGREVEAR
jgi:hypothetical protein